MELGEKKMRRTFYLFSDGELHRKDNTLYFEGESGRKYLPVEEIQELYLFGEININKRLLEFMTQKQVPMHFFNHNGYFIGSYYPREYMTTGHLLLKQVEHYLGERKRLDLAQRVVRGAAGNIRQVLKYYENREGITQERLLSIETLIQQIDQVENINALMAVEGNIREAYYACFDEIIQDPDFAFEQRSRRPPKNNLNTLISFGNSMLYNTCLSEIYKTHLNPSIGYLHATSFRRFTLNLDIAEIFKPIIVDRLIFTLVNKKMITNRDFEKDLEGISIKEGGRKTFVNEFDQRLQATLHHRKLGRNVSYRTMIRLELYKIEKHLIGEEEYEPFIARW